MSTTLVLPGDAICPPISDHLTLGPGIASCTSRAGSSSAGNLIASKLGLLTSVKGKEKDGGESLWIDSSSKRYIPAQRDLVLGTIIARHAEGYRVDVGSAQMATLDALAFEGATKRSKPNLKVGTLVYARVTVASRDMEPEIECFDPATGKAEGFGELKGGVMVFCSLQLCRQLMNPKYPLLSHLATNVPFETAVGMNGCVWLKSPSVMQTIALKRVVEGIEDGVIGTGKSQVDRAFKGFMA